MTKMEAEKMKNQTMGCKNKKKAGRELNGQTYYEMSDVELERYI
ncbi:hypothetical protein [Cognataquiflexum aquatile]|nr:hypothetical protein [Cognataquiflexum aquatile]